MKHTKSKVFIFSVSYSRDRTCLYYHGGGVDFFYGPDYPCGGDCYDDAVYDDGVCCAIFFATFISRSNHPG